MHDREKGVEKGVETNYYVFFFQAGDGIRDRDGGLEFSRVSSDLGLSYSSFLLKSVGQKNT